MTTIGDLPIGEASRMIDEATCSAITGECHPACLLLPEIGEAEFAELVDDIKQHGQRHAIVVDDGGLILDGRHRWRALRSLGVEPRLETFAGTEAEKVALVVTENVHRRHLTTDQRAAIAAELAERLAGAAKERQRAGTSAPDGAKVGKATEQAAQMVGGVSARSVERAKARMKADPAAHEQAKAGKRPKVKAAPKPKAVDGDHKPAPAALKLRRVDPLVALRDLDAAWPRDLAAWLGAIPAFQKRDVAGIARRLRGKLEQLEAAL
jgi:ParB-like chromosome segregation protein Spo0J